MKLAASNIAWKREDNEAVAEMLRKYGVTGIEVTPSNVFDCPWWREQGFEVVAMQGLLYGVEGASLWGEGQRLLIAGLKKAIYLAAAFDIPYLVFGCPSVRNPLNLYYVDAKNEALSVFDKLAEVCSSTGRKLLIEPLPNSTGCWFLNTTHEVYAFCAGLPHSIGVHLDATSLRMTGENVRLTMQNTRDRSGHFHASSLDLRPLSDFGDATQHIPMFNDLRNGGYTGYVSLEQRDHGLEALEQSLAILQKAYR